MQPTKYFSLLTGALLSAGLAHAQTGMPADAMAEANPWPLCPADFSIPERPPFGPHLGDDDTELTSDEADMIDGQVSDFRGNVTLSTKTDAAAADHMRYFEQEERVELRGNVKLWDAQTYLNSETADIKLATDENWFYDASYMMRETRGRGQADEIYHKPDIVTKLKRADYTTCSPTAEFWKVSARELDLDYVTGRGVVKHAVLRIKNVPVFYTPYASFPIDDRRKSGFLYPSAGISSRNGFETQTPYYWNIAPQMDATFTPRVMADRGVMLMGEYRYLFEQGDGQLDVEYLPSDSKSDRDYRGAVSYFHDQTYLSNRGRLLIDYNWVSDIDYFQDFGNSLAISGTRFVQQRAQTQYNGSWWRLFARVQNYQTVDSSIPGQFAPYKRLPQIRFDSRLREYNNQFNFRFQSEAVYFTREDTSLPGTLGDVEGGRFDFMPYVSYPYRTLSAFIEPKAGVRFTQYSLNGGGGFSENPGRTLPFFSLDSGLFFDRELSFAGKTYQQTLEPRIFYLYVPKENQDDLPVFDTNFYDFSFGQLFRLNRFSGADRFGDANQVTTAITSRLMDFERGRELARLSIGQIFFIEDQDVGLPNQTVIKDRSSTIVTEAATSIIEDWEAVGTLQWNPHENRTEKLSARLTYNDGEGRVLNLGYRVRRDERALNRTAGFRGLANIEQTDVSFRWPINPQWGVVGRWNFALPEKKTIDTFAGVEYESCCWAVRAVARRFLVDINDEFETGFFLQFELKGLGGTGQTTATFLEQSIRGYNPRDYQAGY